MYMNFVRILSPADPSSFPHPWISLMSHDSELEELHTMMAGWLAGWFECGTLMIWYRLLLPFIRVSGTRYHCLFVCFSSFWFLQKLQSLFCWKNTFFFLLLLPQKNLKIAKDSPSKQIPAHYMSGLEFHCVGNVHTIYDFILFKIVCPSATDVSSSFIFFLISQKQLIFDLKYTFFKKNPQK
jgi:hypothetical protein